MKIAYDRSDVSDEIRNKFLMQSSKRFFADWIVLTLDLVIEVNGRQHYCPVNFGGITDQEADIAYTNQMYIDRKKKTCIKEVGWKLIEIDVSKKVPTYEDFSETIFNAWGSDHEKEERRS